MGQRRPVRTPAVVFLPGVLLHCSSPAPLGSCSRWKRKRRGRAATIFCASGGGVAFPSICSPPSACVQPSSHRSARQAATARRSHRTKARCRPQTATTTAPEPPTKNQRPAAYHTPKKLPTKPKVPDHHRLTTGSPPAPAHHHPTGNQSGSING